MEAVIVEFEVGEARIDECVKALNELTESLVAKQSKATIFTCHCKN